MTGDSFGSLTVSIKKSLSNLQNVVKIPGEALRNVPGLDWKSWFTLSQSFFFFLSCWYHWQLGYVFTSKDSVSDWQAYPASWQPQSLSFHPPGRIQCPRRQDRPELGLQAGRNDIDGAREVRDKSGNKGDEGKVVFSNIWSWWFSPLYIYSELHWKQVYWHK